MSTTRSISPLTGLALILGGCGVFSSLVFAACGRERDHTPTAPVAAQVSANELSPDQLVKRVNHVADLVQRANTRFDDLLVSGLAQNPGLNDPAVRAELEVVKAQAQALVTSVTAILNPQPPVP